MRASEYQCVCQSKSYFQNTIEFRSSQRFQGGAGDESWTSGLVDEWNSACGGLVPPDFASKVAHHQTEPKHQTP
jgi:hypothetical protein